MKNKSRYNKTRVCLIFWTLFIGLGAVAGGIGMLADRSGATMGMDAMLPYFQKLPFADVLFKDLLFSGIALIIVNGVTNLTASGFLFAKKRVGVVLSAIFGVTLMLWICIQFYMFPINFMSTIYFIFGIIQFLTSCAALIFYKQESFCFNVDDYPNIAANGKNLVVYFSRMGYVKKQAYAIANALGADIYEVKSTEKTDGTLGFWWCGRYGMHSRDMPIEEVNVDLSKYEHITICSPIWVFGMAAPIRSFCKKAKGIIREVDYVLVHFTKGKYEKVCNEMDELLGLKHTSSKSICSRMGKIRN